MKILSLFILVLVIATSVQSQTSNAPSSWKRYTIKDEGFSIIFPTVPAMATWMEYSEHGDNKRRVRQIGAYAEGVVYTVSSIQNQPPKQSLESFIKEQYGEVKTREVTVSGLVGREPVQHTGDWVAQYFATEHHFYAFRTFGAPPEDPRVKQFFASLVLAKNPEGTELSDGQGVSFQPAADTEPQDPAKPTIYVGRDVNRKVRIAMKPQPAYTDAARENQVTGTVILKAVFSSNGDVNNIRTVSGLPFGLTEKAIDAARKIKFLPAVKDGKFVSMWIQLEYNFNLF